MAKLTFFYGEMGSGKTARLIKDAKEAIAEGKKIIVMKPSVDTKNGRNLLSREGESYPVDFLVGRGDDLYDLLGSALLVEVIFVDEAQFLAKEQIDQLLRFATFFDVPVNAYGLRLNFYLEDENFAGATRLLQIAHRLVCLESYCDFCKKEQAIFSCVFVNGEIQISGPSILISDGTREVDAHAICVKCYYKSISYLGPRKRA